MRRAVLERGDRRPATGRRRRSILRIRPTWKSASPTTPVDSRQVRNANASEAAAPATSSTSGTGSSATGPAQRGGHAAPSENENGRQRVSERQCQEKRDRQRHRPHGQPQPERDRDRAGQPDVPVEPQQAHRRPAGHQHAHPRGEPHRRRIEAQSRAAISPSGSSPRTATSARVLIEAPVYRPPRSAPSDGCVWENPRSAARTAISICSYDEGATRMRVLILGGDGYLGGRRRCASRGKGNDVAVVDNFARRRWHEEARDRFADADRLAGRPRSTRGRRCPARPIEQHVGRHLPRTRSSPTSSREFLPDTIIHYGEQPSAPWSMIERRPRV